MCRANDECTFLMCSKNIDRFQTIKYYQSFFVKKLIEPQSLVAIFWCMKFIHKWLTFFLNHISDDADPLQMWNREPDELFSSMNFSEQASLEKPYVCECGRRYKYTSTLASHKRWECGKEATFQCTYCPNYRVHRECNLLRHITNVHRVALPKKNSRYKRP